MAAHACPTSAHPHNRPRATRGWASKRARMLGNTAREVPFARYTSTTTPEEGTETDAKPRGISRRGWLPVGPARRHISQHQSTASMIGRRSPQANAWTNERARRNGMGGNEGSAGQGVPAIPVARARHAVQQAQASRPGHRSGWCEPIEQRITQMNRRTAWRTRTTPAALGRKPTEPHRHPIPATSRWEGRRASAP